MSIPVLTRELAERVERSEIAYWRSLLECTQQLAGNPLGVSTQPFGQAVAGKTIGFPEPFFNRVLGLGGEDIDHLDAILQWYGDGVQALRIEMMPQRSSPELLQALARRGFCHMRWTSTLYGPADPDEPDLPPGVEIREVESEEEAREFASLFVVGFGMPDEVREAAEIGVQATHGHPEWRQYLAWVDGKLGAMASLHMRDGVGSLAMAATHPDMRGRGCQSALIRRRSAVAAAHGCDLLCSQTGFSTTSQHNMERQGLRLAATKAIWCWLAED